MARLRIGVIGLGRRWPRFRQALLALKREARVVAVCDPASAVAQQEARQLGCEAAGSAIELIERDEVDALVLTGGAWFGLWPLEHAARAGKPTLCAGSLVRDDEHADELRKKVDAAAPVHMALWPAFDLLMEAVAQPLGESLGTPRAAMAGRVARSEEDPLAGGSALALMQGLAGVFESAPRTVRAFSPEDQPGLVSVVMGFDEGCVGQLSLWGGGAAVARTWLDVDADGGCLRAEMPRSLSWRDADGRHALEVPGGLAEVWLVDRFVQAVRSKELPACSFEQAYQALLWLRAARQSRAEGAEVRIGE